MKKFLLIMLVMGIFVLESRLSVLGAGLNLTVLLAYWVGLRHGSARGALAGALIGAIADSISGGMLGPRMLSKAVAGHMASHLRGGVFVWSPLLGFAGIMVITAVDGLITYACLWVFQQSAASFSAAAGTILLQAVLNSWAGLVLRPGDEQH